MANHDDITPPNPGRRVLAGGGIAALLGLTAATNTIAFPHPDAELIRICEEYRAYDVEFVRVLCLGFDLMPGDPLANDVNERATAMVPPLHTMEAKIARIPATTPEGILAKALAARHVLSADADGGEGPMDAEDAFVWSLLNDMCGRIGR